MRALTWIFFPIPTSSFDRHIITSSQYNGRGGMYHQTSKVSAGEFQMQRRFHECCNWTPVVASDEPILAGRDEFDGLKGFDYSQL